jgi:hypothetical protein
MQEYKDTISDIFHRLRTTNKELTTILSKRTQFYDNLCHLRNLWLPFFPINPVYPVKNPFSQNEPILSLCVSRCPCGEKNKTNPISPFFNQKSTIVNRQCTKRTHFSKQLDE